MGYCTLADIQRHLQASDLVDLTDDAGTGEIDETVVTEAIAAADALIDGYISGRYAVPLATVPALVMRISVDLAIVALYERKKFLDVPDQLRETRKNAVDLLKAIQRGDVLLGLAAGSTEATTGNVLTNKTAADRTFTAELLDLMP